MEKMTIAGIIAEYNPFHNGHAYHIAETRAAGATHIVAIMSGNFVQRGGPACAPKQLRANAAIAGGADLVIELPLPYAMATAERFAFGAIRLLGALGCVDMLSFGSESADLFLLRKAAEAVVSPYCHEYTMLLLESGITYAAARQQAVDRLYGPTVAALLSSPNDTLAIEYLRQMATGGYLFTPLAVPRKGAAHDSDTPSGQTASATHLRELLEKNPVDILAPYVPASAQTIYHSGASAGIMPFVPYSLYTAVLSTLRTLPRAALSVLPDLSEGLENRLYDSIREAIAFDDLLTRIKTKRYPLARIRRLVWNAYLGVSGDMMTTPPPYLRVLALNKRGMEVLSAAKSANRLPASTSLKKLEQLGGDCARYASLEASATDLYTLGLPMIQPCGSDYTHRIHINSR